MTELQRELLLRALLAGHTPSEVHAFADELRGLSDAQAFKSCTLSDDKRGGADVESMLRSEADPLYAFELNCGSLSPNEEEDAFLAPEKTWVPTAENTSTMRAKDFGQTVAPKRAGASGRHNGWGSQATPPTPAVRGESLLRDLVEDALRGLGVTCREVAVDSPGGLSVEAVLPEMIEALQRGVPVPIALGRQAGKDRRFAVILQMSTSGKTRAFQLYDPFVDELVWANERDFSARTELPFADKENRRLTRVLLPTVRGG